MWPLGCGKQISENAQLGVQNMMLFLSRLVTIGGPVLFLAAGAAAQPRNLRPRVNVFRVDAAMAAAKSRGLFGAEGLDVTITTTPNSTEQMRGISKGTFDLVSTAFDNVLAWSGREGAEIVALAQTIDKVMLPVYVRPEIREWNDLRGKKLAADAVDTAYALVLRRILLAHDLDLDRGDYQLVAVGGTEQRLESIKRGETFAAIINQPVDAQAEAAGFKRFGDQASVLPNYTATVLAVNRDWAEKNRETVVAFLRAWLSGVRWVNDPKNREEATKLVAAELKLNPKAAAERVAELSANGALNISGMETVLNLRTQFGFKLPMGPALKPYYDTDYYRAAAGK
jgi:ABC-type nitrate/sulfonate/bicarbonate transport system substrate-binding protein